MASKQISRRPHSSRRLFRRLSQRPRSFTLVLLAGLFLWLLADAGQLRQAAADALALCARSVVPALFPFLAVSGLLIAQGFGEWAAPLFSGLMTPLFRLPGQAGGALVLGLAGGYPVGAKAAADLYRRGLLTREEASRLLTFCNNASPAFLISVLGGGVFGSVRTGIWLFLIHLLSALLTGLLFRNWQMASSGADAAGRDAVLRNPLSPQFYPPAPPPPFLPSFVEAVSGAAQAMLRLCGFVVFFSTLASPLRSLGGLRSALGVGLLDLFSLTPLLTADRGGLILASGLSGFGGLGVLCQTAAVLDGSGLSVRPCVLGKAVQGLLAGGLAAVATFFLV